MKTPIHSIPVVLVLTLAACGQPGIRTGEEIPPQAEVSGAPADKVAIIRQRAQFTAEGDFERWRALHTNGCRRFSPELAEPLTSAQLRMRCTRDCLRTPASAPVLCCSAGRGNR